MADLIGMTDVWAPDEIRRSNTGQTANNCWWRLVSLHLYCVLLPHTELSSVGTRTTPLPLPTTITYTS